MTAKNINIGILGCGTMGTALAGGLIASELVDASQVCGSVHRADHQAKAADEAGIEVLVDNAAVVRRSDVLLLCVKPQGAQALLSEPGVRESLKGKLLISICAGITLGQLEKWTDKVALIRAMPNTPCLIRHGMTVISPAESASQEQIECAQQIFSSVGRCRVLAEKHLNVVTGMSGSGPAFVCVILEALADGGVMMGLPRDVAVELAAQTVEGTAELVLQTGTHPAQLKDQVTTPAGCTIAGILTMEDGGIRSTLARTIQVATKVAMGLGQLTED